MSPTPWRQKQGRSTFRVVSVDQARAETGLTVEQLLQLPEVQRLTRTFPDGRQEQALRLPRELGAPKPH